MKHAYRLGILVLLAALGCGGDGDDDKSAGTGGAGGTGGAAGMPGPSCVMNVLDRSREPDQTACAECLCMMNEATTNACGQPCWDLVLCVRDNCMGDAYADPEMDGMTCLQAKCLSQAIAGGATAMPFQPIVEACIMAGQCSKT